MKNNLILVIIVVLLVVGGGLGLLFLRPTLPLTPSASFPITSLQPLETVQVQIQLVPETSVLKLGEETNLAVKIDANGLAVIGLDSEFIYDPNLIKIVKVEPAGFFAKPDVLDNRDDPKTGRLNYSLASLQIGASEGTLFYIRVRALLQTKPTQTPLSINRNKIKVVVKDNAKDTLYSENQVQVVFVEQPFSIE